MSRPDDETVNTSEMSVYFHESALSNIPEYYHFSHPSNFLHFSQHTDF